MCAVASHFVVTPIDPKDKMRPAADDCDLMFLAIEEKLERHGLISPRADSGVRLRRLECEGAEFAKAKRRSNQSIV